MNVIICEYNKNKINLITSRCDSPCFKSVEAVIEIDDVEINYVEIKAHFYSRKNDRYTYKVLYFFKRNNILLVVDNVFRSKRNAECISFIMQRCGMVLSKYVFLFFHFLCYHISE